MTAAAQTTGPEPATLDAKPVCVDYQPTAPAPSTLMPKTVDYGHGHGTNSEYTMFPLSSIFFFFLFFKLEFKLDSSLQSPEPLLSEFLMANELY